ncbi:MAG: hypothetical protein EPO36_06565 [Chloroflexota bacterium]|nr:MAG: hypothetical protein EPO36_06565 [Chloroflexota bacterium]
MRQSSVIRHTAGVAIEGLVILATIAALIVAMTLIARGEPGGADDAFAGRNSGVLTIPNGTFAGTTTATANPGGEGTWVMAECFQNGTIVYRQYVKVDASSHQATLNLGPTPSWASGAATCRGEEGYWSKGNRWRVIATTSFEVSG